MKDDEHDDIVATRSASPSAVAGTRTNEEPPPSTHSARPGPTAQVRDPDRYQIINEHGRGGLGRVARAHDRDLGRDVAIKELLYRGELSEIRFAREALITARLEHPSIVPVHEAGRWPDGTPFYAMKLVAGRPLRDLIADRTTVEARIALLHHVIAVADAIAYAHGRNIIHRDLKPANVIVGDFGETIVIDWGLAKDLSTNEESTIDVGPFRTNRNDDLTATGSVLGTPTYMAPEQERGEHVNQRADVFAIGAMLWELCSLQKVPPTELTLRHRMLRRAGIDQDLVTIIDKALERDAAKRYADANDLAADLKAFKAGARIAARSYSLLDMLAHWARRHRGLALSVATALLLVASGITVYVHDISAERGRVEAAKDDLILEHAQLLLQTDPTAARSALATYRGNDETRLKRLLAEARGRGAATAVLALHSDTIWFLADDGMGGILSLGEDSRILLTKNTISTTLANNVSSGVVVDYAPATHMLAYASTPPGIAVLQLNTKTSTRISTVKPRAFKFSPDGSRLAALDEHGELTIWSLVAPTAKILYRRSFPEALGVCFMTPAQVLIQTPLGLDAVTFASGTTRSSAQLEISSFDAQPEAIAVGTTNGNLALLSPSLEVISTISLCRTEVNVVQFVPQGHQITFSCRDGYSGLMTYESSLNAPRMRDVFPTRGSTIVRAVPGGRYITGIDQSGTAYLYDIETRLMHRYIGNAGQPTYVATPTSSFPHVLTGDVNGTIRVWDPPDTAARIVLHGPAALFALVFAPDGRSILTNGSERIARYLDIDHGMETELRGHTAGVLGAHVSPDGHSMLTYGYDGSVRVWRASDLTTIRQFNEHGSLVEKADYIEGGKRIVSVGDDGRLLAWSPDDTAKSVIFDQPSPLTSLEILSYNNHIVVQDINGSVWDVALDGAARQVRHADGDTVTVLRAAPDGTLLAIGTTKGRVVVYATSDWHTVLALDTGSGIRQIVFDSKDRDLLIASEAGRGQFGHVQFEPLDTRRDHRWHRVTAAVRNIAYAPDGETLSFVCADGGSWFYSIRDDIWAYAQDHDTDTLTAMFSPDGSRFASTDSDGVLVLRDLAPTFYANSLTSHEGHHQ